ncbi:hypothetical protein NPIL_374641 [Nephila pilipes]|uniref:Uncharacterized protein n=1 Tax=Nephila pilipes TaxID=299642 RepID=A0A8X6N3J5_NEPPI|nr:hypothetical protein NPIL_374641 [Nephila pilipes]
MKNDHRKGKRVKSQKQEHPVRDDPQPDDILPEGDRNDHVTIPQLGGRKRRATAGGWNNHSALSVIFDPFPCSGPEISGKNHLPVTKYVLTPPFRGMRKSGYPQFVAIDIWIVRVVFRRDLSELV